MRHYHPQRVGVLLRVRWAAHGRDHMSDGQSGPRRSPADTRQEILDSARRFLSERPFRDLTVDRLMEGTAVGRSSFYVHFRDLNELASVLLVSIHTAVDDTTRSVIETESIRTLIDEGIPAIIGVWLRHGRVLRAITDASTFDPELHDLYRGRLLQAGIDMARAAIEIGQRDGLVDPAINAAGAATMLVLTNEALLRDRIPRGSDADAGNIHRLLRILWERTLFGSDMPL